MDNRAIGIFDSGLGGLTAAKALRELMPDENILYFSDSGRMPYGSRSAEQLCEICRQDIDLLRERGVKAVIAACGTISSNAAPVIDSCALPAVGVMLPGARAMSRLPGSGPLGIIATAASIRDGGFQKALQALCPDREIIAVPCPEFASLIEHGHSTMGDPLLQEAIGRCLAPLRDIALDGLLLGCTHYGIIADSIDAYLKGRVPLVSASESAAEEMRDHLLAHGMEGSGGSLRFITSGDVREFSDFAAPLFGLDSIEVEQTPIMEVSAG